MATQRSDVIRWDEATKTLRIQLNRIEYVLGRYFSTDKYESLKEAYLANDESIEDLEVPKLVDPYQLISTDKGVVVSFIPEEYAEEVFKLGC